MRWKVYFFLQAVLKLKSLDVKEYYGFKTNSHSPYIKELDTFESDLTGLIKSMKYRNVCNGIQQQLRSDLKDIEGNNKIFVKADKSGNLYKLSPNKYKLILHKKSC